MTFELRAPEGRTLHINSEWVRVGRAEDNTICLSDPTVSRYHVNFYIKNGKLIVEDAGSQNGFLINGAPSQGAALLNPGDRLFFGGTEYVVAIPGMPTRPNQAQSPGVGAYVKIKSHFGSGTSPSSNPLRPLLFVVGIALMVGVYLKNQKPQVEAPAPSPDKFLPTPLNTDAYKPDHVPARGPTEVTAEGKFQEGLRDYYNLNFVNARLAFEDCLTMNPSHTQANEYLLRTEEKIKLRVKTLLDDANVSLNNAQYVRAKIMAMEALTIISEDVPGFARKVASEAKQAALNGRVKAQEETILGLSCEGTRMKVQCEQALDTIKISRKRLGEEDALK